MTENKKTYKSIHDELLDTLRYNKNIPRVEEILKNEKIKNIHAVDDDGLQYIHYAAKYGLTDIVNLLIEKGADVNARGVETKFAYTRHTKNWTPLHCLANYDYLKNEKAALALIQHGADLNVRDIYQWTPLLVLRTTKIHQKVALLLIDNGADINAIDENGKNILSFQISDASLSFLKELVKRNINLKGKAGVIALNNAVRHLNFECVDFLLKNGINLEPFDDYSPLCRAASRADWDIFNLLLEHGANLNKEKDAVLLEALKSDDNIENRKKIAELCLKQNIDLLKKNAWYLGYIARDGLVFALDLLADHGADINYCDKDKHSPLSEASLQNQPEFVKELINRGVNVKGDTGTKSLIHTTNFTIAEMLVKAGAELNRTFYDFTPLQSAVENSHFKKVKLYLEHGADPNFYGKEKAIPLLEAVSKGRADIIQLLMLHGADKNIKTDEEITIAELAAKSKKADVAKLFAMSMEELKAYQPKRPYLRFINKKLLFAEGTETWNDVIKAQVKKIFGKMSIDAIQEETGEIEYFDVVNQSGKPLYQLLLNGIGDGGLFAFDKASYIGEVVQHGFEVTKKMSEEAEDELRDMLNDAYSNFDGKIRQSVDFSSQ